MCWQYRAQLWVFLSVLLGFGGVLCAPGNKALATDGFFAALNKALATDGFFAALGLLSFGSEAKLSLLGGDINLAAAGGVRKRSVGGAGTGSTFSSTTSSSAASCISDISSKTSAMKPAMRTVNTRTEDKGENEWQLKA